MTLRARITGIGSHLPPKVVTNDDLAAQMDTSDEWIVQRTGIKQRRWVDHPTTTSDLALAAATVALEDAGVGPADLDMIFLATLSPDHEFPGTACFLQAKLDVPAGVPAIDVRQQCTGFVYAMSMADQFIRTGFAGRVLVVGAEVHSKGLEMSDEGRDVTVLFGDGAGAVVVEATEVDRSGRRSPTSSPPTSTPTAATPRSCGCPAPGWPSSGSCPTSQVDRGDIYPKMNGRAVYVNAVKRMGEAVEETLGGQRGRPSTTSTCSCSTRPTCASTRRWPSGSGSPREKVFNTIERFANTTAATIPIGLHEAVQAGRLEPGMLVAVAAFGSGFTWGSMLLRW